MAAQTKTAEKVSINGIEATKKIEPWQEDQDHPVPPTHFLVPSLTERMRLFSLGNGERTRCIFFIRAKAGPCLQGMEEPL